MSIYMYLLHLKKHINIYLIVQKCDTDITSGVLSNFFKSRRNYLNAKETYEVIKVWGKKL